MRPAERRALAQEAVASHGVSMRRACTLHMISQGCYRHQPMSGRDDEIKDVIQRLAATHPRWGFGLMFGWMRNKGYSWNHKRVYRVYRELEMNLRIKPKRRVPSRNPEPLSVPDEPNQCWSMDFMSDSLTNGASFRTLNVIDDFNREVLHIEADISLPAERVIRALGMAIEQYGYPRRIRVDNGPEFISRALEQWAQDREISIEFIKPGKPTQNAYVERFNRSFREEVLDVYAFSDLDEVREKATWWMWIYNRERPHKALAGKTPWQARRQWYATQATKDLPGIVNKSLAACSTIPETCYL